MTAPRLLACALTLAVLASTGGCSSWATVTTQRWVPPAAPPPSEPRVTSPAPSSDRSLLVLATAYNSVPAQTDSTPNLTASGAWLEPGMQALAVSKDLLELGLTYGTVVRIDDLPGEWVVLDRMNARWRNKIDLYMGEDIDAARAWGVRTVRIRWEPTAP